MTKILLVTNQSDLTTDFVVKKLKEEKIEFYRFNTEELTKTIFLSLKLRAQSYEIFDSRLRQWIDLHSFSAVYFRRPELPEISGTDLTDAEKYFVRGELMLSLEGIYKLVRSAYWVSPLYSIRQAENKIYQLEVAQSLGFVIPETIVTNKREHFTEFYQENNADCIIKPLKSGLVEDGTNQKLIFTSILESIPQASDEIESCPQLFQRNIHKKADVRVTVVGAKVFATAIHSQKTVETRIDWRHGETPLEHTTIELPDNIQSKCVELTRYLGLRFGAIDLILDKQGKFIFLEINPNGQWAWIEKRTGYPISSEIVNLLRDESF